MVMKAPASLCLISLPFVVLYYQETTASWLFLLLVQLSSSVILNSTLEILWWALWSGSASNDAVKPQDVSSFPNT